MLSPADCLQLVFLPGFSTKEEVSDLSGRGVGMDVVMSRIKRLNGTVELDSKLGEGTAFRIRVPLTLAVLPALIVRSEGRRFALRSEEHTSELQSLLRISYAVFCLKKKTHPKS